MKVFIAVDSLIVRNEINNLLSEMSNSQVDIVGQADDAQEAMKAILNLQPDVAILDIQMPNGSGIEVLQTVKHDNPNIKVIMLTKYLTLLHRVRCLSLGANYLLDKPTEMEKIPMLLYQYARQITSSQKFSRN